VAYSQRTGLIERLDPRIASCPLSTEKALHGRRIFLRRKKSNGKAVLKVPDDSCDHGPHAYLAANCRDFGRLQGGPRQRQVEYETV
jgi:hypothetical protein